jgi:tRNA1(Val) A37 N6-methylase TrmN6
LEPGFGKGSFLLPLIERFLEVRGGDLEAVLTENIWGIEIDPDFCDQVLREIERRWGPLPERHNLACGDFLVSGFPHDLTFDAEDGFFDLVIGNPPFGGTVSIEHQDELEKRYGRRNGMKIKRETYSLFLVRAIDLVKQGGTVRFICSDTFLTIPTMKGLRFALMTEGRCEVEDLEEFSPETSYPMVVLTFQRGAQSDGVTVNHQLVGIDAIESTPNLSWTVGERFAKYFGGPALGDFVFCTSGMTTGKNEYFVREIKADGSIDETHSLEFYEAPITVAGALALARLGKLSAKKRNEVAEAETAGETQRCVRITELEEPRNKMLPHADYRFYNKAQKGIVYSAPKAAIYWANDGDAVYTFKKTGKWYLHGVGGAPFFGREGLTWNLISSTLDMRYLPEGYILDSGAPCAFLRDGVHPDELWFILGWCLTDQATEIIKSVLNHTMNIQSKDVERLPYPVWVSTETKAAAVDHVRDLVARAKGGEEFSRDNEVVQRLSEMYALTDAEPSRERDDHVQELG